MMVAVIGYVERGTSEMYAVLQDVLETLRGKMMEVGDCEDVSQIELHIRVGAAFRKNSGNSLLRLPSARFPSRELFTCNIF
jgi:hypothetical protein